MWRPRWAWACRGWLRRLRTRLAVLRLLAFLAPEPVPLGVLLGDCDPADPAVAATVGPLAGDVLAVGDAVAALRGYSLVSLAGDGLVLVHRLVQAITRDHLPAGHAAAVAAGRRRPDRSRGPRRAVSCRGAGRCARCCCRTPGPSWT